MFAPLSLCNPGKFLMLWPFPGLLQDVRHDCERLVVPPLIPSLGRGCVTPSQDVGASVPFLPHSLYSGSSLRPHLARFAGDGSVSYTDLRRKLMWNGCSLQSLLHVTLLFGRSRLVHEPWVGSSTAIALCASSTSCRTSARTLSLLSFTLALLHWLKWEIPSPCHPVQMLPIISLDFRVMQVSGVPEYH